MKTLTLRIYINDGTKHKTVQLTSLLTSAMVVQYFRKKGLLLDSSEDWTLFEVDYSHDIGNFLILVFGLFPLTTEIFFLPFLI